jgi:DNA-binding MarR family transcriptional regulator
MTRTIQRLVKQGYVEQQAGEDKRKKHIQLTAKAVEEFPAWEAAVLEANGKVLKLLPEHSQEELQQIISEWNFGLKGRGQKQAD